MKMNIGPAVCATILTLLSFNSNVALSQITAQRRSLEVDAMARDAIFDEDNVNVADSRSSDLSGFFGESIAVAASTITGTTTSSAEQFSYIDPSSGEFYSHSVIETVSQEDGTSNNSASAFFLLRFQLPNGGNLILSDLTLLAQRGDDLGSGGQGGKEERSDDAIVLMQINRRGLLFPVAQRSVRLRPQDEQATNTQQLVFDLPPGSYSLVVRAKILGEDRSNEFQGQPRGTLASFFVDGEVIDQPISPF